MRSRARSHRNSIILLALGASITLLGTISLGSDFYYDFDSVGFSAFHGVLQIHKPQDVHSISYSNFTYGWFWPHIGIKLLPEYNTSPRGWFFNIPLWPLALILLSIGAFLFYKTRPVKPGLCPRCRYDRSGLPPSSLCPECAEPSPDAQAR